MWDIWAVVSMEIRSLDHLNKITCRQWRFITLYSYSYCFNTYLVFTRYTPYYMFLSLYLYNWLSLQPIRTARTAKTLSNSKEIVWWLDCFHNSQTKMAVVSLVLYTCTSHECILFMGLECCCVGIRTYITRNIIHISIASTIILLTRSGWSNVNWITPVTIVVWHESVLLWH